MDPSHEKVFCSYLAISQSQVGPNSEQAFEVSKPEQDYSHSRRNFQSFQRRSFHEHEQAEARIKISTKRASIRSNEQDKDFSQKMVTLRISQGWSGMVTEMESAHSTADDEHEQASLKISPFPG